MMRSFTSIKPVVVFLLVLAFTYAVPRVATALPQAPSERMNHYPFALVHGFFGWGRNEMLGWKHFGGFNDLQQIMTNAGYYTVTPAVGPLSSNWDRACELYAQLVGGTVDYGAAHAQEHGHARFGRTYEALLPGLGQVENGKLNKVNIIAHSQGSPTVRLLIELIAHGSVEEMAAGASDTSPLFEGNMPQFIHSLATISGANDGSLLAHTMYHDISFENQLMVMLSQLVNMIGADALYDFKLDQFGLAPRQRGESHGRYFGRAFDVLLEEGNIDTAFYDLSADGAQQINEFATAEPDVYYFSWANNSTFSGLISGLEYPELKTNMLLSPFTLFMGTYNHRNAPGGVGITSSWRKNDGVTSTRSMAAPINGSVDTYVDYAPGNVQPGIWNYLGELDGYDHWDVLGLLDLNHSPGQFLIPFYLNTARFLASTPQSH